MRFFVCCVLMAIVALAVAVPVDNNSANENAETLYGVDVQGHENIGDREARQFGYGGYRGGYGGYGGYRGGYGGYGRYGGYGGYRGGYGGYRGGYGGYRGGFYG